MGNCALCPHGTNVYSLSSGESSDSAARPTRAAVNASTSLGQRSPSNEAPTINFHTEHIKALVDAQAADSGQISAKEKEKEREKIEQQTNSSATQQTTNGSSNNPQETALDGNDAKCPANPQKLANSNATAGASPLTLGATTSTLPPPSAIDPVSTSPATAADDGRSIRSVRVGVDSVAASPPSASRTSTGVGINASTALSPSHQLIASTNSERKTSAVFRNSLLQPMSPSVALDNAASDAITSLSSHMGLAAKVTAAQAEQGQPTAHSHHLSHSPPSPHGVLDRGERDTHVLVTIPFFEDMDKKKIRALRDHFQRHHYAAGDYIVHAGDKHEYFFVIISGAVQLFAVADGTDQPQQLQPKEREHQLALLHDGQWFGHMALVEDHIHSVGVKAVENTVVFRISKEEYKKFIAKEAGTMEAAVQINGVTNTRISLHSLPFFACVDEIKLQQLSCLFEFKRYNNGDVIVKEGEIGDGFYIILRGSASVYVEDVNFQPKYIDSLVSGDWFGEVSLLHNTPRTATVRATEDKMIVMYLEARRFHQFLAVAPEVRNGVFEAISRTRTSNMLKLIPLFDVLRSPEIEDMESITPQALENEKKMRLLAELFHYENADESAIIFKEGDRADKLYLIIRGKCEVTAQVERGRVRLSLLGKGDMFGEIALISPTVRSATVTAIKPCVFLALTADKFARFLEIAPELRKSIEFIVGPRTAAIIENIPFFRQEIKENKPWSKTGLLGLLCQFEKREKDEIVFRSGDRGDKFYVIVAGMVSVRREQMVGVHEEHTHDRDREREFEHKDSGENERLTDRQKDKNNKSDSDMTLKRGAYFGEESLLHQTTRTATVRALTLTVLLTLTRQNFEKFLQIAPEFKAIIMKREQFLLPGVIEGKDESTHATARMIAEEHERAGAAALGTPVNGTSTLGVHHEMRKQNSKSSLGKADGKRDSDFILPTHPPPSLQSSPDNPRPSRLHPLPANATASATAVLMGISTTVTLSGQPNTPPEADQQNQLRTHTHSASLVLQPPVLPKPIFLSTPSISDVPPSLPPIAGVTTNSSSAVSSLSHRRGGPNASSGVSATSGLGAAVFSPSSQQSVSIKDVSFSTGSPLLPGQHFMHTQGHGNGQPNANANSVAALTNRSSLLVGLGPSDDSTHIDTQYRLNSLDAIKTIDAINAMIGEKDDVLQLRSEPVQVDAIAGPVASASTISSNSSHVTLNMDSSITKQPIHRTSLSANLLNMSTLHPS